MELSLKPRQFVSRAPNLLTVVLVVVVVVVVSSSLGLRILVDPDESQMHRYQFLPLTAPGADLE